MMTFSERLRHAMVQADTTQVALAEKSGCSRAAVSQYLSGVNTPTPARMKALADALGVKVDFLAGTEVPADLAPPLPMMKISVYDAARCMGKSDEFVKTVLQMEKVPFGIAVPGKGKRWSYYINPVKFRDYVGAALFDAYFAKGGGRRVKQSNRDPL